ncbi:MAG: choice-of-anchor D domain-containing protein [Verrucomicrobiota bacterium]
MLLAVMVGMGKSQAQEQIYGSGDFILNHGAVISDTGTLIGGTITTRGSIEELISITEWGTLIPVSNDQLPHSINASAVNGTVTKSPDRAIYDFDTPVILTATPDAGYVFEKWTLKDGNTAPKSLNSIQFVRADLRRSTIFLKAVFHYEMVAHFVPMTRIISVSAVDLSWDQQAVGETSGGTFKITNTGNAPLTVAGINYPAGFSGSWEGTIAPGSAKEITVNFAPNVSGTFSGNITVNSDATAGAFTLPVTAVAQPAYSVTATSSFGALKTTPDTRTFWQGSIVTLKATPVAGYVFMNWTEDQKILSTGANFDLEITREHHVWADYLPVSRTLKVKISRSSALSKEGATYRGTISVKNTGTVPVFLSELRFQGKGTGRILVNGRWTGWIKPGSTFSVKISFTPSWLKFHRLRVLAIAKNLTSPVEWAELRR